VQGPNLVVLLAHGGDVVVPTCDLVAAKNKDKNGSSVVGSGGVRPLPVTKDGHAASINAGVGVLAHVLEVEAASSDGAQKVKRVFNRPVPDSPRTYVGECVPNLDLGLRWSVYVG
jgi:hypothetical protein